MMITLIKPTLEHKEKALLFKNDFILNNEIIHGGAKLQDFNFYEDWLNHLEKISSKETVYDEFVPSTTFFAINKDNSIIGIVDIRHELNDFLSKIGGHIGYSVLKAERNKGYGTEILKKALIEFKKISNDYCLVTCDEKNLSSENVIIKNGGIFDGNIVYNGKVTKRYFIK